MIFIRTIFSFFPFCSKNEKIDKWHTYRLIFHNSIFYENMTSVASNFLFFLFFWINRKTLTIHPFRQFFIFYFIEKWRRKVRSYEYFNGEERKNLIRIHYRLTNLVRRFTQGRRRFSRCGRSSILF